MASIKKHKIRPAPDATAASPRSAAKRPQRKTVKGKSHSACVPVVPGSWQLNSGVVLLCIVATAILYTGDLHLGFFRLDDQQYVVSNRWIQRITWKHLTQILFNPYYLNYSPLHLLSYALDCAVGGLNAYAFHLSSNLRAGVVAGFVYLVALALTQERRIAIVAALLFVVHSAHVEAVVDFKPQGFSGCCICAALCSCIPKIQTAWCNRLVHRFTSAVSLRIDGKTIRCRFPRGTSGSRPDA